MSAGAALRAYGQDRAALLACAAKHQGLADHGAKLRDGLSKK